MLSDERELVSQRWRSFFDIVRLACDETPLAVRCYAARFVGSAINEMTFEVEVIVDVCPERGKFL